VKLLMASYIYTATITNHSSMIALLQTVILGFMVGLSGVMFPGPVFVLVLQQSFTRGFWSGFWVILAHAMVGLAVLVLILVAGITTLFQSPAFELYVGIIGGFSLCVLGVLLIIQSRKQHQEIVLKDGSSPASHPFIGGLIVSVSNPQFFLWWALIALPSIGLAHDLSGLPGIFGWTAGILVALFAWYGGIAYLAAHGKERLPSGTIPIISLISGLFLLVSGLFIFANYYLGML
jgi:threonine/homoserine/homoserine lactone efflux protein